MMRPLSFRSKRRSASCSMLALATVLAVGATPASAQSFLGSGTYATNPNVLGITTGPNSTTINLNPGQTVIDWVPTDNATGTGTGTGAIGFQLSGTTATFTGASNFAVINNIRQADMGRAISMNGTINSLVGGQQGGSVYFYSSGGFVLGPNSLINVGSLVLSASPLTLDVVGGFITGASNHVTFRQAPNPGSSIVTAAGSRINATAPDAYVAMVAPRVQHGGAINVAGSAALVAAEAATISFSPDGLFDIQVSSGSTSTSGVSVTGDIGGPASSAAGDNHRVYLVAVPKNQAMTMVIGAGADLGFDIAGAANVVGNTVVLSAGHDVVDGSIAGVSAGSGAGAIANLEVRDSNFTSALVGEATGYAHLFAFNPMHFYSDATIHADGEIWFSTQAATGAINVDGNLSLSTARFGENGQSVAASLLDVYTLNGGGSITVDGTTTLDASAIAGGSGTAGIPGGNATGGQIAVNAAAGGRINLNNGLTAISNGHGGNSSASGVDGGDGTGGTIFVGTTGSGSHLSVTGATSLDASGFGGGGNDGECFSCDGASGDGFGGSITVSSTGVNGSTVGLVGDLMVHSDGTGGSTPNGTAGNGRGGTALFSVNSESVTALTGNMLLSAVGQGGAGGSGNGGDGRGGRSGITETVGALSGAIRVTGNVEIDSDGRGGHADAAGASGGNGFGGDGVGGDGRAYIIAFEASTSITGSVDVHSIGTGGTAADGTGGDGRGGLAYFNITGLLDAGDDVSINANAFGGNGVTGGTALGGDARITANEGGRVGLDGAATVTADASGGNGDGGSGGDGIGGSIAEITATNGGRVTIQGSALVSASGIGGNGAIGGLGAGSGTYDPVTAVYSGGARIFARNGAVVINGGAQILATGTGGNAIGDGEGNEFGGDGGDGFGGYANVFAENSDSGPSSITINVGSSEGGGQATVNVNGIGGAGGNGANGATGGAGGAGNAGRGEISAAAGNGTVTIGQLLALAQGIGGIGGAGGSGQGTGVAGGDGGVGGLGNGGVISVGSVSGAAQSLGGNNGFGNYGSVVADASATGGRGGDGASGTTWGNGGNGGDALGGGINLLVRGSRVDVDAATLIASATGGDSGDGATGHDGNGGNATIGSNAGFGFVTGIDILATGRFGVPTQRGTLNAGAITGTAIATGGVGSVDGNSVSLGAGSVTFLNADGNIGSLDVSIEADGLGAGALEEAVSVVNGTVLIDDGFAFTTPGNLSLFADNGSLTASTITLHGANFVADRNNVTPGNAGTFFANSFDIRTGDDFLTTANLDSVAALTIDAPGLIDVGNVTADGDIDLAAETSIALGNARSGGTIELDAGTTISGDRLTAGDSIYAEANGPINLGNISAGLVDPATGDDNDYVVGLLSGSTINTGDIAALGSVGIGARGNITTGNVDAGNIFLVLGGGNMSFGSIVSGGPTYLANASMIGLGGNLREGEFNPAPILAAMPVASGGSITLRGAARTGQFRASSGTTFTAGDIASRTNIWIESRGNLVAGDLDAGLSVTPGTAAAIYLDSLGSLRLGNAVALGGIDFDAVGSVTGGNLTSGLSVLGSAGGAILLGNLSGGVINPQGPPEAGFSVGLESATSITTGAVEAARSIGFASSGMLNTGKITAGADLLVLAHGNIALGNIDAGGRVYLGDSSMYLAAGGGSEDTDFDPARVFAAAPVATGGSIAVGNVNASRFEAAAGTSLTGSAITSTGLVQASSGGNTTLGRISAGSSVRLNAGGAIDSGNIIARTGARVSALGAVKVGDITLSGLAPSNAGIGAPVELFGASIVAGNISTNGTVGLYTAGDLTAGTILAGDDVIALVGDDAAFGAITTPESFFLGGYGMFALVNGSGGFTPQAVFNAPNPSSTGGSATFAGSSSARSFQAFVGDDTALASLRTVDGAQIDTGGVFTLTGALNGDSQIISSDIDIGASASVNNGYLSLVSRNASQTLIGDGLDAFGQGYRLSDAEADRIHTAFSVAADTAYGAAAKLILGDLTITAPGTSENEYEFGTITGDPDNASVGSIKIVGDVVFNGMDAGDELSFDTNLFQLDAATGSLSLFSQGTTLGGELGLYAPRIWVASGDILAKLDANSTYAGYVAELNAPAAVQHPEGVIRAGSIDIDSGDEALQSLLVQNTGTAALPAGFLTNAADIDGDEDLELAPGSVNLVINGQLITPSGTITGIAARDLLVTGFGAEPFIAGSTINGCAVVGTCLPEPIDPIRIDAAQIGDGLGEGSFGDEGDGEESGDGNDRSGPISPPNRLLDSRLLNGLEEVDDPISGAGNPSLYGPVIDDDEDEEKKKAKARAKQGEGK